MGNRGSTGAPWQSGTTGRRRMMNSMPTWAKKQEPTSKKREKEEEEGRRKKKKKPKVNASLGMRLPRLPHRKTCA